MQSVIESIDANFNKTEREQNVRGLKSIRMFSLKGTVVVAGANGSGKSRLLQFIQDHTNATSSPQFAKKIIRSDSGPIQVVRIPSSREFNVRMNSDATDGDKQGAKEIFVNQATNFSASLPMAVRATSVISNDFIDTGNRILNMSDEEAAIRTHRWKTLQQLVNSLLGYELSFDDQRRSLIEGSVLDSSYPQFSEGQQRLYQFAVALAGTSQIGMKQIVTFDEPETSLHPDAAIKMIRKMQQVITGQLWIATHSVPLIAALGIENVWYAENGSISYGGRRTERVINSLMGGRENVFALRNVIAEPDRMAMARFAAECLGNPEVVETANPNDPQLDQALTALRTGSERQTMRVLDWGCGKARLKIWLDRYRTQAGSLIDYWGYEPNFATAHQAEDNSLRGKEGAEPARIYTDVAQLKADAGGSFDAVVLSNVLHEIDPAKWLDTFHDIDEMLASGGRVLILEDYLLPVGELPTLSGFFLLDAVSCGTLFRTTQGKIGVQRPKDEKYAKRLVCFEISRVDFTSADQESIKQCLKSISQKMLSEIEGLRQMALGSEQKRDYEAGHRHALAVMQYANAELAIAKLG